LHADKATGATLMNTHAVDLVLSGHNHDLHIDFDGRTALVESEQDANYVTIVDIDVTSNRGDANGSLTWWPNFRVVDTAKAGTDPAMLAKVQMYNAGLNRLFDVEIATLVTPLDSRAEALRTAECSIGNLVADSIRNAATADVATIDGGSILSKLLFLILVLAYWNPRSRKFPRLSAKRRCSDGRFRCWRGRIGEPSKATSSRRASSKGANRGAWRNARLPKCVGNHGPGNWSARPVGRLLGRL
jgi:5'-nucleotidase, C-terminal domain